MNPRSQVEQTYDRLAGFFSAFSRQEIRDAYLALLPVERGARVLDAGCGAGQDACALAARGASVLGVDVSREMLARARARQRSGECTGVEFRHCDAEQTGEPDGAFDAVLSSMEVFHHENLQQALFEYARLLRLGGTLVLVTNHPVRNMFVSPGMDYFFEGLVLEDWGEQGRVPVNHWSLVSFVDAMANAGLTVRELIERAAPLDVTSVHDHGVAFAGRFPSFLAFRAAKE